MRIKEKIYIYTGSRSTEVVLSEGRLTLSHVSGNVTPIGSSFWKTASLLKGQFKGPMCNI